MSIVSESPESSRERPRRADGEFQAAGRGARPLRNGRQTAIEQFIRRDRFAAGPRYWAPHMTP